MTTLNQTVILKRSAVAGKVPTTADIQLGEVAINTHDGKLYIKKNDGSDAIVTVNPTLASVATTGSYNDLANKPTIPDGTYGSLTGKPSLATVATSGSYNDLTSKPTIPTLASDIGAVDAADYAQYQSDVVGVLDTKADNDALTSGLALKVDASTLSGGTTGQVLRKVSDANGDYAWAAAPSGGSGGGVTSYLDLTDKPTLFSGAYADLTGKPTIPTDNASLTNGAGYATQTFVNTQIDSLSSTIGDTARHSFGVTQNLTYDSSTGIITGPNLSGYALTSAVPTNNNQLTNGSGFVTQSGARTAISATQNLTYNSTTGVITGPDLSGYATTVYHTRTAPAYATTINIDLSTGSIFDITLTGNATINFTNGVDGQKVNLRLKQDATGGRTVTWGTMVRFGTDVPSITLTTSGSKMDRIGLEYHATDSKYDVIALAKGY